MTRSNSDIYKESGCGIKCCFLDIEEHSELGFGGTYIALEVIELVSRGW